MSVAPHPTKGSGWWHIIYRPGGAKAKMTKISFQGTEIEARSWESELRRQSKELRPANAFPRVNEVSSQFLAEFKIDHQPAGHARVVRSFKTLLPFFGSYQFTSITSSLIERYKAERIEKVKPTTVQKELAALSGICKWAAEKGYCQPIKIKRFPSKLVKAPIPEIPSKETVLQLIDACRWPKSGLAACLYYGGLRSEEARLLTVERVFLEKRLLVVTGKGNKQRVVPIQQELEKVLRRRIEEVKRGILWPNIGTGAARPDIRFDSECDRLGIPRIKPHALRHAFGSHATRAGMGIRALQLIMGHCNTSVTEIYSHLNAADLVAEMDKL